MGTLEDGTRICCQAGQVVVNNVCVWPDYTP
jgi:hypothetical protein